MEQNHQTPPKTTSSFFPRGYENPEDFSLDASGCFCRATSVVGPSSSSSFPDDDDVVDDDDAIFGENDDDEVVVATSGNQRWIAISKRRTTHHAVVAANFRRRRRRRRDDDDDVEFTEVVDVYEKRKKHCRRLPVYAKRRGGGQEEERFFCMSVEVDGDAIFGVVREDGTRDTNDDDDTNHHHHHHHHATAAGAGNSSPRGRIWCVAFEAVYGGDDGTECLHFMEMWRNVNLQGDELPREVSASVTCLRGDASRMLVVTACGAREYAEISILDAESGEMLYATTHQGVNPRYVPKVWPVVAQVSIRMSEGYHALFARTKDRKRIESFGVTRFVGDKYTARLHNEGEIPRVTRGLDQFIGGMCVLPPARRDTREAHPKLCVAFSEDSAHLKSVYLKKEMARHVMKRDSVVRMVMYNVMNVSNRQTGSRTIQVEETHRVELEDSIVTSPIDLDSMTASPVSSSYVFFAHVNGDVSVVLPRTGVVLKTLRAAHDPKYLASTGSVNFALADRAYLSASARPDDANICLFSSVGRSACTTATSCWSIASPSVWTRQTHHLFPKTFKDASKTFLCCARLGRKIQNGNDTSSRVLLLRASKRQHAANENRQRRVRRKDEDTHRALTEKEFTELVYTLAAHEPGVIERIIGALAVVTFRVAQSSS